PLCQYYAYVEILDERETGLFMNPGTGAALWRNYQEVSGAWPNFEMKRVASPGDIYPVFRELFAKQEGKT
ncbi:MAG: YeaH/YhbH family protein, partial [Alphaproteobacteria bacterium]|nr:YeaH/YhbH family protein [Alphaproteobacteria bacterium]